MMGKRIRWGSGSLRRQYQIFAVCSQIFYGRDIRYVGEKTTLAILKINEI